MKKSIDSILVLLCQLVIVFCLASSSAMADEALSNVEEQKSLSDEDLRTLFQAAYGKFNSKDYHASAVGFYRFISQTSQDAENYEWAQFFFGISLEKLGYSHGSIDTMTDLVVRKPNPKIVTYILEMFDTISRSRPFDEELILAQALNGKEYGFLDSELAAMVHYYQGVYDWEYGLVDWGIQHFNQIPEGNYYYYKYLYHSARYALFQGQTDKAISILELILQAPVEDIAITDLANWTLARLLYEKGEFERAIVHYKNIKTPVVEQASFLLEQAWNYYSLEQPQKAMGMLYAFEAPSFERFFTPEFYLLKSFIYKSVCNYEPALSVVESFHQRYDRSLVSIYKRDDVVDEGMEKILLIILNNESISKRWDFVKLLEKEKETITQIEDEALQQYLLNMYSLKISQNDKMLQRDVDTEFERIANALLKYEEEVHLMRYEIGIDMYQRVQSNHYDTSSEKQVDKAVDQDNKVIYPFQGEFWNDELDNYKVILTNKCKQFNDWDVFFE